MIFKTTGYGMVKYFMMLILLFYFTVVAAQNLQIKSMEVYTSGNRLSLPVIKNGEKLIVEFDVQSDFVPSLKIVFRFCDYDWTPTRNSFLLNSNKNFLNLYDFERLPASVSDADYHFTGSFPDRNNYVELQFSGKWRFFITDVMDTSIIYASGKFFVVDDRLDLKSIIKTDELEDQTYWPKELAKVFNITTDFYLPEEFYPGFVERLEIIENRVLENPIVVQRNDNTLGRQFKWDADRKFTYIARDIQAGNEYRQVDIRNASYFIAKDVKAQRDGLEQSRFFLNAPEDLNGNKIFLNYLDPDAIYLNVTFSIRPPDDVYGDIFIIGAFNDWVLSQDFKLQSSGGIHSITIPLKRGIYDYQYVVADDINGEITNTDWVVLEGNTWSNNKEYDVFLYYKETDLGGYERIIGYNKLPRK